MYFTSDAGGVFAEVGRVGVVEGRGGGRLGDDPDDEDEDEDEEEDEDEGEVGGEAADEEEGEVVGGVSYSSESGVELVGDDGCMLGCRG